MSPINAFTRKEMATGGIQTYAIMKTMQPFLTDDCPRKYDCSWFIKTQNDINVLNKYFLVFKVILLIIW